MKKFFHFPLSGRHGSCAKSEPIQAPFVHGPIKDWDKNIIIKDPKQKINALDTELD
jgi:hypothetical protein